MKKISVVTGCLNEVDNLEEFYSRLVAVFQRLTCYDYEIIIADNYSIDGSRDILRRLAAKDKKFKVIFNSRNFGQVRSPYNAFIQATGDAVVAICSDLQTPPEMIIDFVREWEKGADVVCAVKPQSRENILMNAIRKFYYWLLASSSEVEQIHNFTGFGLYDRKFMKALEKFNDPYPYLRGMVGEIGLKRVEIPFIQEKRKRGKSKNNFFTLYNVAMSGFIGHSKLPLRIATFFGCGLAGLSLLSALGCLVCKLLCWKIVSLGSALLVISVFFLFAMQMIFIGIIGEYIGAILTQVKNHPLVIEDEKLNFD